MRSNNKTRHSHRLVCVCVCVCVCVQAGNGLAAYEEAHSGIPAPPTGAECIAATDAQFRARERGGSSDEDSENEAQSQFDPSDSSLTLLAPPVSMMLAVSSRYQLRPYFGAFWLGGLLAFVPVLTGTSLLWLLVPTAYLIATQVHSIWQYNKITAATPMNNTHARNTQAKNKVAPITTTDADAVTPFAPAAFPVAAVSSASASAVEVSWSVGQCVASFKRYAGWRLGLESEQRQDDIPSWTALALVVGYAWLIVLCLVVGSLLQSRRVRVCGGLELEDNSSYTTCGMDGWGGGATPEEYAAALLLNTTQMLPHYQGQIVLSLPFAGPTVQFACHAVEPRMLVRAVSLSFWFFFATSAVITVVLAWGINPEGRSMVWKQLQTKHRKARRRDKAHGRPRHSADTNRTRAGELDRRESVVAGLPGVASPPACASLDSWLSESQPTVAQEFELWLWTIARQHHLHGIRFLLLIDSDRLEGLRQLRTDEVVRAGSWSDASDHFLHQYLILLEVVGQMVLASKMWGVRLLDGWLLTPQQKDAAQALGLYQRQKLITHTDTDTQQTNTSDDVETAAPSPPIVASPLPVVRLSASHWKLCCLVVAIGLATWIPFLSIFDYRSYVIGVLDGFAFAGLFCFMCVFTYLVGRVMQYPYLCYSEAYISVLTLYHTKLRLTLRNQLKVWRDLRHYLVLYRLPLLFGLAQWSLMALTLTAVVGLLLCILDVWRVGFSNFIIWYGSQCLVIMTVVSLGFSFAILASAVSVWEQQQAHIRLLQDTKFAILLKQRKEKKKEEDEQERKEMEAQNETQQTKNKQKDKQSVSGSPSVSAVSSASVSDTLVLRSVEELIAYIADHDQAPTAFGIAIKPTLFRLLQGYIVTGIASLLIKYGAKGTE